MHNEDFEKVMNGTFVWPSEETEDDAESAEETTVYTTEE
jgi:hypothetical protein